MRKFFLGLFFLLIGSCIFAKIDDTAKGVVVQIDTDNDSDPKLVCDQDKLMIGSSICAQDVLMTTFHTSAIIRFDNVSIIMKPLTILQVCSIFKKEQRLRVIFDIKEGELFVSFDSNSHKNSLIAFVTKDSIVLVSDAQFNLTSTGFVKTYVGLVDFYDIDVVEKLTEDFSRGLLGEPSGSISGGMQGRIRQEPISHLDFDVGSLQFLQITSASKNRKGSGHGDEPRRRERPLGPEREPALPPSKERFPKN